MKVLKFGGSSVADASRIQAVGDIVAAESRNARLCVVLSALKGTTDVLLSASQEASSGDPAYSARVHALEKRHVETAGDLLDPAVSSALVEAIHTRFSEVASILRGVELVRECTLRTRDLILGYGELISVRILEALLASRGVPVSVLDSRTLIVTDGRHGSARVNRPTTYERIQGAIDDSAQVCIVPGFVAATPEGVTTTLGRNGSDYTASLVAAAVNAEALEIWTDVDGVLSADPRYVANAFVVPEMSFAEASELSYFGAEVLHPSTMLPVIELDIPVDIRNTMNPDAPGTRISATSARHGDITGIASIENVSIINVEGSGMVGIPGIAARIFGAIGRAGANVIMISQASSEHTICLCFRETDARTAMRELERELAPELAGRDIEPLVLQNDMEIVAIIGDAMRGRPGVSGRLFDALGAAGISVHAIAQGSSERNISFIVAGTDRRTTLQTVHDAFFGDKAV